ncbi:hypothetical protein [uncultured Phascolarctobacterium sp.]|uniref:hypothetical protein n=1 Tax=Phascolarctobacterium sp. TaxID=2049039 RepID=UPI0025EBA7DA|nr:hypothetical protein [uncultured Phascolarctobacterium sp.]
MAIILAIILILAFILLFICASTVSYTLSNFIWPGNKSSNTMEFDNNTICEDDTDYHFNQEITDKYAGIYDPDVLEVLKDCDEVCSRSPIKKEYLH